MYHVCDLGKISESAREKSERDIQNGDDIDRTDYRQFLYSEINFRNLSWCMSCQRSAFKSLFYRTQYAFWVWKKNKKNNIFHRAKGPLIMYLFYYLKVKQF